jgi:hypothetical protein
MALRWIALLALAALAACSSPPRTNAMGAGPGCDLRIDVRGEHRCPMTHVSPDQGEQLISNGTRSHD